MYSALRVLTSKAFSAYSAAFSQDTQSLQDEVMQLKAQLDRLSAMFPTEDR